MNNNITNKIKTMTTAALLCAMSVLIIYSMPKIIIGPATYTFASHVPIILAMFISPLVGIIVAIVSALGYLLAGLPFVVFMRALSHIVFVVIGAYILKKFPNTLLSPKTTAVFAIFITLIHVVCESIVVAFLMNKGFAFIVTFIGFGGAIHALIDFSLATVIWVVVQPLVSIPANAKIRLKAKATN